MKKATPSITLTNVYKRYGELEAVSDVTMAIYPGEVVGFVGPNGAGKTTTISLLMGFLRATKGAISVLGQPIQPETAHEVHAKIGYVAGDIVLPDTLTGKQYLTYTAAQNGRDDAQYDRLLKQLDPVLNKPIKMLSRGNKQKVALVAALQHDPKVLILDEPTSGLDPLMQDVFLKTIQLEARRGTTVLMSSHILSEVSSICTRIIFMRAGKFIIDKPVTALTEQLGKHVVVTTAESKKLINYLPGSVQLLGHTASEVRLNVPIESMKPFMRWLLTKPFDDIVIENRDLDDVFHELYGGTRRRNR